MERRRKPCPASSVSACALSSAGATGRQLLARAAPRPIGQDLATTTYATIASMQVALLFLGWSPSGIIWWQEGFALTTLCTLYLVSWLLLLKAIRDAGFAQQIGLLGWWAVYRKVPPCYAPMPQRGLFRFCRQPIYVAFAMTLWTVPAWTPDQLEVAVVLTDCRGPARAATWGAVRIRYH